MADMYQRNPGAYFRMAQDQQRRDGARPPNPNPQMPNPQFLNQANQMHAAMHDIHAGMHDIGQMLNDIHNIPLPQNPHPHRGRGGQRR